MSRVGAPPSATLAVAALGFSLVLGHVPPAAARAGGIVTDTCQACHASNAAAAPALSLTADPATFNPGDLVPFTLIVRAPSVQVAGAFINTGGVGTLRALPGEGLQVNGPGLTHIAPKAAVNGAVSFRFTWQAPAKPGGVDIHVAALAGNGNGSPTGDAAAGGDFQWTFGCAAQSFYLDLDRDGFGAKSSGTRLGCAGDTAAAGFAIADGDCNENDETVHPGAAEICNAKDDNCDGQIDEGTSPVMMWPDQDGDGYYKSQTGVPKVGCGNVPGYALQAGDCNESDPAVHPGASEICNLQDDDCDGNLDERVRPQCGLGWCARESLSCRPEDCSPGPPMAETCNAFDDDCDGEIDNDACPSGEICTADGCVPNNQSGATGGGAGGGAGAPAPSGGSSADSPNTPEAPRASDERGCALGRGARAADPSGAFTRLVATGLAIALMRRKKSRKYRAQIAR